MTMHETERSLEVPPSVEDPVAVAEEFYRANGYRRVAGEEAEDREEALSGAATFERGEKEARWWSSDMSKLPTTVRVDAADEELDVVYRVDTTGQRLTDGDRDFWEAEMRALDAFLEEPAGEPVDMRADEAARGARVSARMFRYGLLGAMIVFIVIVGLGLWLAA
ncbi:MAG: hypothetical protein ABEL76_05800 [Bradymonadaceae bacterium]